jgi:hypothetical protein
MNTWWYRAVGTVGVAGGFLLLAGATAQAAPATPPNGPQPVTGAVGDLLNPTSGLLGPLGVAPSNVLPSRDAVPGVVNGPVIVPPPGRRATETDGDRKPPVAGVNIGDGQAATTPSTTAGASDLLGGGDLLSGGDLTDLLGGDLLGAGGAPTADQLPALLADRMATQQPELFSTGLPLLGGLDGLPVIGGGSLPGTMPQGGTPVTLPDGAEPAANQGTGVRPFSDGRPTVADQVGP